VSDNPGAAAARECIQHLAAGEEIERESLERAFDAIWAGNVSVTRIAALLMGLRVKGESPREVAAIVGALRRAMVVLPAEAPDTLVDTCGTGGGRIPTFNISTAAALLVAGAGARVAKHGNRSYTTKCGSADVLEALGISIEAPVEVLAGVLRDAGIVFMFAPLMHPAMRFVAPVRGDLAVETVMNIVGPLANPAFAGRQVVGVAHERRLALLAETLCELGSVHALVVHGSGMDEISPLAPTQVLEVQSGTVRAWEIDPNRYGFGNGDPAELAGGDPAQNAEMVLRVLGGDAPRTATAAVVLNAAAALYVGGQAPDFDAGVELARAAMARNAGLAALERMRDAFARRVSAN
jgi:anthranilate phosphoribosyltransferase